VRYITIPLSLVTGILLARVLGPHKLGIYAMMMWLPGILAGPMSLGIGNANLYFAAQNGENVKPLVANTIWICVFMSTIVIIVTFTVLRLFPNILPEQLDFRYIIIPLLQVPFRFFIMFIQNIFNALGDHSLFRKVELIQQLSYFSLCVGGFFLFHIELWGFVYARIFSLVIPCLFIFYILYMKKYLKFIVDWHLLKKSVRYGVKIQCSSMAKQFSQKIDEMIVLKFAGAVSLGFLSICRNNVNRIRVIPYSLATVVVPEFAKGKKESPLLVAKSIRILLLIMLLILLVVIYFIGLLVPVFYGHEYVEAVFPMQLMVLMLLPMCVQRLITFYLMINDYATFMLKSSLATAAILILLDLCLIPQFGLIGAISAGITALIFESVVLTVFFLRLTGIDFLTMIIPTKHDLRYLKRMVLFGARK
jgi:O-antigen/teichoic acid export membrane protein